MPATRPRSPSSALGNDQTPRDGYACHASHGARPDVDRGDPLACEAPPLTHARENISRNAS